MNESTNPHPIRSYRDLIAWQRAMTLAKRVYEYSAHLPPDERFGLIQQMRRSAVSVPSNIAEGYGRGGPRSTNDYVRFLRVARGSLAELETQILIATELFPIGNVQPPFDLVAETDRVLQGLLRSLEPLG